LVHHPGQHEAAHRNEQSPEHSLHLLVLPERLDHCIWVSMHPALNQLGQEHEERQEQDRSTDKR